MKIGIIGSGGREHAICLAIKKSKKVKDIYCFPGNAGTSKIAKNISIDSSNFETLKNFIIQNKIDVVIVGPEKPLVNGIVDFLEKNKIKVFGPNKFASQLEGSKIFTKKLCKKYNIPTAKFGSYQNIDSSLKFIRTCNYPIVVKADGLAAGKGVYICKNEHQSKKAIKEIFNGKFGEAKQILIEEFLKGEEMSFFVISDGKTYRTFGTAQDHKRVNEGDKGVNTGGMGAYSPSRLENKNLEIKILSKIIEPTFAALKKENKIFKGILYAGLMIIKNEPYLIEYNVRMGDPECQTILPRLKTDFLDLVNSVLNQDLKNKDIKWQNKKSVCIVLCSQGYPKKYKNNLEIKNLKKVKLNKHNFIFHAGTKRYKNKILSNGGRVLNFVSLSDNFKSSRESIISNIKKLNWTHGFFRKDIGYKVINE